MIHYTDLTAFLKDGAPAFKKGPVALLFAEDEVELDATIRHHLALGFKHTVVFAMPEFTIAEDVADQIIRVSYNMLTDGALETAVNAVMKATGDIWIYYCFNSEFLFYPFCEHRTVGEMIAFNVEERRDTILSYVVDLYTGDLWVNTNANKPGLVFLPDHTFNEPEYNTYACPWHHNLTAAVCSFRTAKALKRNPGSTFEIDTFKWHNSAPFEWHSQQLLDLGLMEPGQWF